MAIISSEKQYLKQKGLDSFRKMTISLILYSLTSCNNMDHHDLKDRSGVTFNPPVGSSYQYEINEVKEVVQEIGKSENKVKLTVHNKITFLFKILKKSSDSYSILANFISYDIENYTGGNPVNEFIEKDSTHLKKSIDAFRGAA